jgi:hypothetical protein
MNAASETVSAINHGFAAGRQRAGSTAIEDAELIEGLDGTEVTEAARVH